MKAKDAVARRTSYRLWLAVLVGFVLGIPAGSHAQAAERQTLPEIEAAAIKEGRFLWYESIPFEEIQIIFQDFQKKYPAVKPEYVDVGGAARLARISQESMAGGPTADISTLGPAQVMAMAQQNLLRAIDWQALGIKPSPDVTPNEYMINTSAAVYFMIYNTDKVKPADAPKSYDALLDPKWKGRTGLWARPIGFVGLRAGWGDQRTDDYVRKLAVNTPRLYRNPQALAEAVGAGESDIGILVPYHTFLPSVKKGAPIAMDPIEPVAITSLYGFLPKAGRNPNASKLFLVWLSSADGARSVERATGRGNPFVPGTEVERLISGKARSVTNATTEIEQADRMVALEAEYQKILERR